MLAATEYIPHFLLHVLPAQFTVYGVWYKLMKTLFEWDLNLLPFQLDKLE